jgi:hypothetical protein
MSRPSNLLTKNLSCKNVFLLVYWQTFFLSLIPDKSCLVATLTALASRTLELLNSQQLFKSVKI